MSKTMIEGGFQRDRRYWHCIQHKLLIVLLTASILVGICGSVSALLIKLEGVPLAYDAGSNVYWYTDLSRFTFQNYQQQLSMIESISIEGFSGFHLADASTVDSLLASISSPSDLQLFTPTDIQYGAVFWTGRTNEVVAIGPLDEVYRRIHYFYLPASSADIMHQAFSVQDILSSIDTPDLTVSAWVAGNQDQAPVPEPGSLLLLSVGIISLVTVLHRMVPVQALMKGKNQ